MEENCNILRSKTSFNSHSEREGMLNGLGMLSGRRVTLQKLTTPIMLLLLY